MFSHYLKLTFRSLMRNKVHGGITLFGLALGMACSLVILLFVYGEWSYDRHFAKGDRTYRIGISFFNMGKFANGPERTLAVLQEEFPGLEVGTRISREQMPLTVGERKLTEAGYFTDSAFFTVFDYPFLSGDPRTALDGPNRVVLTTSLALALFDRTDVLGATLGVGKDNEPYTVTGVIDDPDFNTHLHTRLWLNGKDKFEANPIWTSAAFHTYVRLREGVTEQDLAEGLERIRSTRVFEEAGKPMGFKTYEDFKASDMTVGFIIHPLRDIYLTSKNFAELYPGGNEANVYIFSAIALFVLLLAAVNFVNLTTAKAVGRAKEVGIRKTLGTTRISLARQFFVESVVITLTALLLALVLAEVFSLVFYYVNGAELGMTVWSHPFTLPWVVAFALGVGLLSGAYPALYLTSFQPAKVLKGKVEEGRGVNFRNYLVVFQFTVSAVLIIVSIVVSQQLHFMQTKDLGFEQDNVVTIDNHNSLGTQAEAFKNKLSAESGITLASFHAGEPGSNRVVTLSSYHVPPMEHPTSFATYRGDESFLPLCGIRILKGRNFTGDRSDSLSLILSEAAVMALGLPEDPIGHKVNERSTVVGVVGDLHTESLRSAIRPVAFAYGADATEISFKLDGNAVPAFLKKAEDLWKQMVPSEPFRYHFLDDNFGQMIKKEAVLGKAINVFTVLAILISCLGLYGLSAHTAANRTKEIGIRKVMGATVRQIVALLSKEFLILVGIAIVIAAPVAWYAGRNWLEGFAYRIDVQLWVFVATGALAVAIALLTLSYQTLQAASRNPVESLRNE